MLVELTPRGTRGAKVPKLSGPLKAIFLALNRAVFRLFGRRMRVQGRPLLLLTTVGARTGQPRYSTLGWFPDNDDRHDSWLVVASYAGAAEHPSWYVNLAKHPLDAWIELGGRRLRVRAASLRAEERDRAWRRIASLSPGYAAYQEKTDREIPIVRLTAVAEAGAGESAR